MIDLGPARLAVVVTPKSERPDEAVSAIAERWAAHRSDSTKITAPPAQVWPFTHPLRVPLATTAAVVWMPEIHEAFINYQIGGTRLVTTQASFLMQAWLDATSGHDVLLLATAARGALDRHAPEVRAGRGLFRHAVIRDVDIASDGDSSEDNLSLGTSIANGQANAELLLAQAMRTTDPRERLALCVRALDRGRTPPALLATASACMEVNDLESAADALEEALAQAPEWAAAHFERGKLWLRADDMDRASASFREAAERMPGFASAWANLGAALGELDRREEALAAFEHALQCDPMSHQALNNIGVVNRELGKLGDSESAFRQVIALAPDLAFGYYNLGHTLFLQGRYQAALSAYVEGQKRDPERNPVQASRLAMCQLAVGDPRGALSELQRATTGLPRDYKLQLLADTSAIAWALLTHRPELAGWQQVNDWLSGELARLS